MHSPHGSSPALPTRRRGIGRRAIVAGLGVPFLPRFAHSAEFTWRVAHNAPDTFPLHIRLLDTGANIAARSGGQMALQVYPSSELGIPVGLIAQLRAGTVDAVPLTNGMLANSLTQAALPMTGFAFSGYDKVWPAMDGEVGAYMRDLFKQRLGLIAMERSWDFGFRQVTSTSKTIKTAADMAGLRLRTPPEADFIDLFQALKAFPVAMPLTSLQKALAGGAVDGQEGVLPLVKAASLFKVQSLCAMTNHVWDGQWICVSEKSWSNLPDDLQGIVAAAFNESALNHRQDTAKNETALRVELEATGMRFNAVETQGFRKLLRTSGYYAAWKKKMGDDAWDVLTNVTDGLT